MRQHICRSTEKCPFDLRATIVKQYIAMLPRPSSVPAVAARKVQCYTKRLPQGEPFVRKAIVKASPRGEVATR